MSSFSPAEIVDIVKKVKKKEILYGEKANNSTLMREVESRKNNHIKTRYINTEFCFLAHPHVSGKDIFHQARITKFLGSPPTYVGKIAILIYTGGLSKIRTCVAFKQQIYSLPRLTTSVSTQRLRFLCPNQGIEPYLCCFQQRSPKN